jgi:tol-pal system protein YbgF
VNRVQLNVAALQREVNTLRDTQEELIRDVKLARSETRAQQARTTELATLMAESGSEVAALRTRMDAAEAEIRASRIHVIAPAPATVAPPPTPPPPAPTLRILSPAAPPPAVVPAAGVAPAGRPNAPPTQSAEQAYQTALATYRAREHGQAVLEFLDFIARYPGHALVANAQYWIGEAYYGQHDYRQAIAEFRKVSTIAPASGKAADALLKIGYCYRSLRDEARARQTWQQVTQEFPRSEAAAKARALLKAEAGPINR